MWQACTLATTVWLDLPSFSCFYFISCSNLGPTLLFISCCSKLRLDSRLCPFTWPLSLLAISAICISHAHQHHKWEPSTFVHIIMERMIRDISAVNNGLSYWLYHCLFFFHHRSLYSIEKVEGWLDAFQVVVLLVGW